MFSPAPEGTKLPAGLGRPVAGVQFLEQVGGHCELLPRLLVAAGSTTPLLRCCKWKQDYYFLQHAVGKHGVNTLFTDLGCRWILHRFLL